MEDHWSVGEGCNLKHSSVVFYLMYGYNFRFHCFWPFKALKSIDNHFGWESPLRTNSTFDWKCLFLPHLFAHAHFTMSCSSCAGTLLFNCLCYNINSYAFVVSFNSSFSQAIFLVYLLCFHFLYSTGSLALWGGLV